MPNASGRTPRTRHWTPLVLTDVQFWIPIVVFCGGLLVLRWIS